MAFENPVFNRDLYEVNPLHHSSNSNNSDLFLASLEEDRRIEASIVVAKGIGWDFLSIQALVSLG